MLVLGISAFYHDGAAALVNGDKIVAAAQEERFTRKKHDPDFPKHAIEYCLREGGVKLSDVSRVVFYDKPFLKFERLIETYVALAPKGFGSFKAAMPTWVGQKLFLKDILKKALRRLEPDFDMSKLLFTEHHLSHAASAYYPSPFEKAAILTLDGVGEWCTTSLAFGEGTNIQILNEIHFPHSLGLLYSAFTYYTGFKVNSGEYKLMGLAPYGEPRFRDRIFDRLIDVKADGSFRLDLKYFDYCTGLRMTNEHFDELFGAPPRTEAELLQPFHMDIAASIQAVTTEVVLKLARHAKKVTGSANLCLAGGVALNCVANGVLAKEQIFDRLWIQPASGDCGGSLGAALAVSFSEGVHSIKPNRDGMMGSYLGPEFSQQDCEFRLQKCGAKFFVLSEKDLTSRVAGELANGKAVGWFQGRMEFGPRALGNRSILGDPRSPETQRTLNLKVKYRESFRPFAPSVLDEDRAEWFDLDQDSPYMLLVGTVKPSHIRTMTPEESALFGIDKLNVVRSTVPAITHIDYSARIQTVHKHTNPKFHALIAAFKEITGVGMLVNTSFNVRGEPIVCTPEDAFRCFMGNDLDVLVVQNCVMIKEDQDPRLRADYSKMFEAD